MNTSVCNVKSLSCTYITICQFTFHKTLPTISQMIFMIIAKFILYFSGKDVDVSIKNLKDESW